MSLDCSSLNRFIDRLPDLLEAGEIKIEKIKLPGRTETNWDTPAREVMGGKFRVWLEQELDLDQPEIDDVLFVEGLSGRLPPGARGDFFGSVCCPDLALKSDGYRIAIELDRGSSGSELRDALTKASFNVLVGKFARSVVLFFVELNDSEMRQSRFDPNHPVLKEFKEKFSTSVIFVTNYQPSP